MPHSSSPPLLLHPHPTPPSSDLCVTSGTHAHFVFAPDSRPDEFDGCVIVRGCGAARRVAHRPDRKSTRLNSSHLGISYAVFCLKKKRMDTLGVDAGYGVVSELTA